MDNFSCPSCGSKRENSENLENGKKIKITYRCGTSVIIGRGTLRLRTKDQWSIKCRKY